MNKRVVITGMAVNTPIGDTLDSFFQNLVAGKSAITSWKSIHTENIYGKIGGDLADYDIKRKCQELVEKIPQANGAKLKKLTRKMPWNIALSMLVAADAFHDADLFSQTMERTDIATIVAGHNLNQNYVYNNHQTFQEEPDFIDGLFALYALDTNHVGSVTEVLELEGSAYTVGGACASGNMALKNAVDTIVTNDANVSLVVAPVVDFASLDLHAMALMGAITYQSFNDFPERASRPYDTKREGFVPSHGAAALVVESLEHAEARGANIYAEVLGVACSADGSHLPKPSQRGQAGLIRRLLKKCKINPEDVDYINAHATSTPLGDITEIASIKEVFGDHAYRLKINAPKSLLGHNCWSAATVETVAAILQMKHGTLHRSINIDELDPQVDLDVCRETVSHEIQLMLKNSFGFGGLNSSALLKRFS